VIGLSFSLLAIWFILLLSRFFFLFLIMCCFQFSLQSKCSPRYFTDSTCGSTVWLMLIAGQLSFLRVKVMCDDLVSLTFIFHFLAISLRCWGIPEGCVRLSWDLHGSQIWLYHPRMCPSLCPWMSVGQMCIVCKAEVPGCFLGVPLSGFGSRLRFRYCI